MAKKKKEGIPEKPDFSNFEYGPMSPIRPERQLSAAELREIEKNMMIQKNRRYLSRLDQDERREQYEFAKGQQRLKRSEQFGPRINAAIQGLFGIEPNYGFATRAELANQYKSQFGKPKQPRSIKEQVGLNTGYERFQSYLGGINTAVTFGSKVYDFSKQAVGKAADMEKLKQSINFTTGDITSFQRITELSEEYGLNLQSMAKGYANFAGSTKDTKLAGKQTEEIFESVSKAARVMNLSGEDAEGVFKALGQMMSKGKVQSEELRHQLGDRMPGAFKLAAKAMGVSTDELEKLMKSGKIMSEDFLPKFAKVLEEVFGGAYEASQNSMSARIDRLTNSYDKLLASIGNTPLYKSSMDTLTKFFDNLRRGTSGDYSDVNMNVSSNMRKNIKRIQDFRTEILKEPQITSSEFSGSYRKIPEKLKGEAIRMGLGTYVNGELVVKNKDIYRVEKQYYQSLKAAKMGEAVQMIREGDALQKFLQEKIQTGNYTQQEMQDFQARLYSFHQKKAAILPELGSFATEEAYSKTFGTSYDKDKLSEFEQFIVEDVSGGPLGFGSDTKLARDLAISEMRRKYKNAMQLVNLLPPPKPGDIEAIDNVTGGGDVNTDKDRIVASQPKVLTINILTGRDASLIKNMDISEIQDSETGMVSPEFRQKVINVLYEALSDSSQLLAKQVIK